MCRSKSRDLVTLLLSFSGDLVVDDIEHRGDMEAAAQPRNPRRTKPVASEELDD